VCNYQHRFHSATVVPNNDTSVAFIYLSVTYLRTQTGQSVRQGSNSEYKSDALLPLESSETLSKQRNHGIQSYFCLHLVLVYRMKNK
jgi:hypothetical protein